MNLVTLDNDNKLTSADVYDANSKQSQADINARLIDVSTGNKFQFGIDANGNYGYIKEGADSVTPFNFQGEMVAYSSINDSTSSISYTCQKDGNYVLVQFAGHNAISSSYSHSITSPTCSNGTITTLVNCGDDTSYNSWGGHVLVSLIKAKKGAVITASTYGYGWGSNGVYLMI